MADLIVNETTNDNPTPRRHAGKTEPDCYLQRFAVSFGYPVYFTRGALNVENPRLVEAIDRLGEGRRHRSAVFIDEGLLGANPHIAQAAVDYFSAHSGRLDLVAPPRRVAGGEPAKQGTAVARSVMQTIADDHLDRQSVVVAIGGGSMLDAVGLAASLVHRGVRLVRVPSTTLSQCDSGVGVKNGVNDHGMKNFAGTFAPPFAVLNDVDLLRTLPDAPWFGGVAEAFKVAVIKDAAFLDRLAELAGALRHRDEAAIEEVVRRAAQLHLEHIRTNGDPFEMGAARPLDFGHWSAHRLEVMSGYELGHGQAVAVGVALDTCYAAALGHIAESDRDRVLGAMRETGLPTWSALLDRRDAGGRLEVLRGIEDFREHLGGRLNVTLPAPLGRKVEVHEMDAEAIAECIGVLRGREG